MASIAGALARIKQDPLGEIDRVAVERLCWGLGHDWRDRELDPATTLALFVQQVLHGNTPCGEVRHLAAVRRCEESESHPYNPVRPLFSSPPVTLQSSVGNIVSSDPPLSWTIFCSASPNSGISSALKKTHFILNLLLALPLANASVTSLRFAA